MNIDTKRKRVEENYENPSKCEHRWRYQEEEYLKGDCKIVKVIRICVRCDCRQLDKMVQYS